MPALAPDVAALYAPDVLVRHLRSRVGEGLTGVVTGTEPTGLYDPMRYALEGEGKRLRPLLVLLAARLYGVAEDDALPAALAVEVFHAFTLVHDDIMDHAPERRGRPTVHVRWSEPVALLAGDGLLGEAYRLLGETPRGDLRVLLAAFSAMVARLCEGQALDAAFETDDAVTVGRYLDMIDRKTGALLVHCLELGGLVGGAPEADLAHLRAAGRATGRAFQILDDLLDLTADDARWGKAVGGDLVVGKKTYLLLGALERATGSDAAFFSGLVARGGLDPALVPEARARMEALGVLADARVTARSCSDEALGHLGALPGGDARDALVWLVREMSGRLH